MSRLLSTVRTRLAAAAVTLAAAGTLVMTGGTADAAVTSLAHMDAHCYSDSGAPGSVAMNVYDFYTSGYTRAVRVLYHNNGATTWSAATGWYIVPAGEQVHWLPTWRNPGTAGWHMYGVETQAYTASGWQSQGVSVANTTNYDPTTARQVASPYPGWCYA